MLGPVIHTMPTVINKTDNVPPFIDSRINCGKERIKIIFRIKYENRENK